MYLIFLFNVAEARGIYDSDVDGRRCGREIQACTLKRSSTLLDCGRFCSYYM